MRKRTLLVLLAVLAMILAACGSGDEGGDTTTTADSGSEETTTTADSGGEETTTTADGGAGGEAPESIKIGAVVPITGPFAGGGAQVERGYRYAVEAINEAGGVFVEEYGVALPLELDLRDDASDPNQTTSIMEELGGEDIVAYLGGFGSPVHAAGTAIAERNQIAYLGVATALQALHEQGYQYYFSPFPKSPDIAISVFELLDTIPEDIRPSRVGIFQETTDWGEELGALWEDAAQQFGYEVVLRETYAPGSTDFTDIILQAQAQDVEILLSLPTPPDGFAIYQQMGELGWKAPFNLVVRAADVPTWNDLGEAGEGVLLSAGWHPALGFPGIEEMNQRHIDEEGRPADPVVGGSYSLVQILAAAIESAGTLDHQAVRDAIAATDMMTVAGPITFREDGTSPITNPLMQRIGGGVELVWPAEAATQELVYPSP
ncbi:MAG TPA: amino acid ABC transporter substrate-binding protein [Acidimicrobiia bacterium]|nr:amino acid ABC transporter substrate-binding protein [Acidimicrobiia bacterium]